MITLWRRWRLSRALSRAAHDETMLAGENARLRVALEEERVKSLVLQKEVDLLAAVHVRDVARWAADTPAIPRNEH